MTALSHEQVSARLKQLPSLPSAVSELLASFSNEEVDVEQIARLIGRDQGLTARVLRVANSSFMVCNARSGRSTRRLWSLVFAPCAAWSWRSA